MKHASIAIIFSCVLLTACVETPDSPIVEEAAASSTGMSSSVKPVVIEAYPSQNTVEHFKQMALSGTNLVIGRVLENNSVYAKHYVTYNSNGVLISGTLSLPHSSGAHALIIQNHGYIDPAIYTNGRGLRREQDAFARAGFAVLHTDYRKHAQSDPDPDSSNIYDNALAYALDSANAVLAVRELNDPRINATKVGMIGHSMGGGVTMHVLVAHPELIDAAVLYAPINAVAWLNFERWRLDDRAESTETLAAMETPATKPEVWDALSQTGHLMNLEDPILLFHGTNDKDVPVAWSDTLADHLTAMGKNIRYVRYPGEGHEFAGQWSDFINQSIAFYQEELQ